MSMQPEWGWEVNNLTLGWGKTILLGPLNLHYVVNQKNALPIMGLSGEGKSTFLYLLASYKQPLSGEVQWLFPDGRRFSWSNAIPLSAKERELLRSHYFGFSFQNNTLLPFLTVRENLLYALHNKGEKIMSGLLEERISPFLNASEQEAATVYLERFPHQLSGGQKQRFALAKALIHDPCVLFADEPTGQLDVRSRQQVMETLHRWVNGAEHRLIIWVTHHHLSDLDLMGVDKALFLSKRAGEQVANLAVRGRAWIANWAIGRSEDAI